VDLLRWVSFAAVAFAAVILLEREGETRPWEHALYKLAAISGERSLHISEGALRLAPKTKPPREPAEGLAFLA